MPGIVGIYPLLDVGGVVPETDALTRLDAALAGGAKIIQLRAKKLGAGALLELARAAVVPCHAHGALLIINDRPDVALLAGADGVHLGQDDLPYDAVRSWLPQTMAIGVSCHRLEEVMSLQRRPVPPSYLAYGPVFATRSKQNPEPCVGLEGLKAAVVAAGGIPVVAIGGLDAATLPEVRRAGATSAALIQAIFAAPDVRAATEAAVRAFARGAA